MFGDFLLVDLDSEAGAIAGTHESALLFDLESLLHHVLPPRDVVVHRFANDVAWRGEAELQRGGGAHRALWIVGREGHSVRLRHGGYTSHLGEAAAVGDVALQYAARPLLQVRT